MNKFESEENEDLKSFNLVYGLVRAFLEIPFDDEEVSSKEKLEVLSQILSDNNKISVSENKVYLTSEQSNNKTQIYAVDKASYTLFEHLYDVKSGLSLDDLKLLQSNRDRFLDEEERRRGGDFYTPRLWVKEGHKLLSERLGENWKNEYVIWDCCCGTGNLTRGLNGVVKYLSTLSEADVITSIKGNQGCFSFQYDFLNDDVNIKSSIGTWNDADKFKNLKSKNMDKALLEFNDTKLYKSYNGQYLLRLLLTGYYSLDNKLVASIKNKKSLLILINPPYAAAGNLKDVNKAKCDVNKSLIQNDILSNRNISNASENLYSQFFYRILCLIKQFRNCNIVVASYVKSVFWTAPKFYALRKAFEDEGYIIDKGFMFRGSEFSGCSDNWGLTYSIIRKKKENEIGSINECNFMIKEREWDEGINDYKISDKCSELLYSLNDNKKLSTYVKDKLVDDIYDGPQLSNSLNLSNSNGAGSNKGYMQKDGLGYLSFHSNCVDKYKFVFGLSSCVNMGSGFCILPSNYDRAMIGFVARKLIKPTWINQRKEFMKPNEMHNKFNEFQLNSYILCMFIDGASWSSLRDFEYHSLYDDNTKTSKSSKKKCIEIGSKVGCIERIDNSHYNIYNEFFWMSKSEIQALANQYKNISVYEDCENDIREESFTYLNKIKPNLTNFSVEAKQLLNLATSLVKLSFPYRKEAIKIHPDWHLNTWDAGWYQIKKLIESDLCKEDNNLQSTYKNFKESLSILQEKMKPLVYELGFLK